jgi:hypothetical protein
MTYRTVSQWSPLLEGEQDALVRLLAKARQEGIRLYRDSSDGRHYASSASTPGKLHYVTAYSCDCQGYAHHQRCKHHSALLSALGWISGEPDPTPDMIVTVSHVDGHYADGGWLVGNGTPELHEVTSTITVDGIDTLRITGDRFSLRVVWLEHGKTIDDLTGATPAGSTHHQAVQYWVDAMGSATPGQAALEAAGLLEDIEMDIAA